MILQDVFQKNPAHRRRKRVGRGPGSTRGKTCTRGMNGQFSRAGADSKLGFEGGTMPLYRRLPHRGFNNERFRGAPVDTVNVGDLERVCAAGETVDVQSLIRHGLTKKHATRIKVLGGGELTKALHVKVHAISASARQKIESASGSVELEAADTRKKK